MFCLRGADVPVGELSGFKFHCAFAGYLVEDKSLFHLLLWVLFAIYTLQKNRNKNFHEGRDKEHSRDNVEAS